MDNTMNNVPVKKQGIKISTVLDLMKDGYTRTNSSRNYNPEIGSIQEYFSLSDYEVKHLFSFSKLKNAKTSVAKPINFFIELEDDTEDAVQVESTPEVVEPEYGGNVAVPGVTASGVVEVEIEDVVEETEPKTVLSFSAADMGKVNYDESMPFQ